MTFAIIGAAIAKSSLMHIPLSFLNIIISTWHFELSQSFGDFDQGAWLHGQVVCGTNCNMLSSIDFNRMRSFTRRITAFLGRSTFQYIIRMHFFWKNMLSKDNYIAEKKRLTQVRIEPA